MKILAVNTGSSSLKFQLFNMPEEEVIASGIAERIGINDGIFSMKLNGEKIEEKIDMADHTVAVNLVLEWLQKYEVIADLTEIVGVGHRIVQGGDLYDKSVVIDDKVIADIAALSELAPLHNPAHLLGIEGFATALPWTTAVAVFDTAFHQTMPAESYIYALSYSWYTDYSVRKYGFHGTSHMYVSQEAARMLNKPYEEAKVIVCHLGNGASICAVKDGKSYDTSMGFTPLAGIPMGTRSGDIDPAIISYMSAKLDKSVYEVTDMLNKESGFKGISGGMSDARDIETAIAAGDAQAQLTLDIYAKKIAEFVAGYYTSLGGADMIVFTAGIGENADIFRAAVADRLAALGVELDKAKNSEIHGKQALISSPTSNIALAVIPTNEELVIARDTHNLMK
jgi:acetate kinase